MQNSVFESCMSFLLCYYALSVLLDTAFHYCIHCSEFRIHVLCQSDLALCTDQIMLVPLDLKILVTSSIIKSPSESGTYSRTISSPAGTISRFGTSNCSARFWSKRAPGSIWYGMLCRAFTSFAQAIASSIPML